MVDRGVLISFSPVILTHSYEDPYNPDHPYANMLTLHTRVYAQAAGYPAEGKQLRRRHRYSSLNTHQPEQRCEFKPQVLLDITPVYEIKEKAMESGMEGAGSISGIITATWPSGAGYKLCGTPGKRNQIRRGLRSACNPQSGQRVLLKRP